MARKTLIVVQGMGRHTAESAGNEARSAFDEMIALYPLPEN